jgi:hypothetical protein
LRRSGFFAPNERFECFKKPRAVAPIFRPQPIEGLLHHRRGPAQLINCFGCAIVGGFGCVGVLRVIGVQRHKLDRASSFLTAALGPFIDEEMIDGGEQKGSEPASSGISQRETTALEQSREKLLRQVFGVLGVMAFAANIGVEWIPVGAAKLVQRMRRAGRIQRCGRKHDAPVRGGEPMRLRPSFGRL